MAGLFVFYSNKSITICFNQKGRFNYMLSRPIYYLVVL